MRRHRNAVPSGSDWLYEVKWPAIARFSLKAARCDAFTPWQQDRDQFATVAAALAQRRESPVQSSSMAK